MHTTRRRMTALSSVAAAGLLVTATMPPSTAVESPGSVARLTEVISSEGVLEHLEAFQEIADENGGDRAAGRPGYGASAAYVAQQLIAAGYLVDVQEFTFEYIDDSSALERVSPEPRTFVEGQDFRRNGFDSGTPQGEAEGPLAVVPAGGCAAADFAGVAAGDVALIQRGTCPFSVKALNAEAAGAAGAIVWNNEPGPPVTMIGDATGLTIPVVFATLDAGEDLASTPEATVRVEVEFLAEERTTTNVLAQTREGRNDRVVMAGAHLDSVQDGAGVNDNGSGSAALLEIALQMRDVTPGNAVRFAWWGAEEEGLLGSRHYVSQLGDEAIADIALYLNFDMIASPNYTTGIYDGDNSGGTAPEGFIPPGSAEIEDVFEAFYDVRGLPFVDSEFSGRSDYGPFIAVGIPAGGLFTGAEVPKTAEEAEIFGGVADAAKDPCYHQACDNLSGEGQDADLYAALAEDYTLVGNVNVDALDQNADAAAAAILTFAWDTPARSHVARAQGRGQGGDHAAGPGAGPGHHLERAD